MERDCCEFICGAPTTFQVYGIELNRICPFTEFILSPFENRVPLKPVLGGGGGGEGGSWAVLHHYIAAHKQTQ